MVENIFTELPEVFVAGVLKEKTSYYFSIGEIKKTVFLSSDSCVVEDGRSVDNADCVCKTSPDFFSTIWEENYRPGMKDFMTGTIKSNNPNLLQNFLQCFGK
jgi:putative sterol carrier protein